MQYHIVEADNTENLTSLVENYLKAGWKLQGGVAVVFLTGKQNTSVGRQATDMSKFKFFQAVIKND